MGRGFAFVVALLVAATHVANAGHRVHVVTEPPGAHVYINDTESGAVCDATPCDIDPPYGESSLIVQLEKYAPDIEAIDVKRGGKTISVSIKLKAAIATIVIEDANAKGASIAVDGSERGKVPTRVDVEPGGHQVKVTLRGKTLFDDFVDVETGDEKTVQLAAAPPATKEPAAKKEVATGDDPSTSSSTTSPPDNEHDHEAITKTTTVAQPSRFVLASGLVDFGFRRFQYGNTSGALSPPSASAVDEDFNSLAGAAIELWPFELVGVSALRHLSLYARLELPIVHLQVANSGGAQTNSASYELSARYRIWLGDSIAVDLSAGYVDDQLTFGGTGVDGATLQMLPEADYASVRSGLGLVLALGSIEAYAAFEGRYVLDGGELAMRWQSASVYGLGALGGLAATVGPIVVRAQFEDVHYMWTFTTPVTPSMGNAQNATDKVFGVTVFAGYQY